MFFQKSWIICVFNKVLVSPKLKKKKLNLTLFVVTYQRYRGCKAKWITLI